MSSPLDAAMAAMYPDMSTQDQADYRRHLTGFFSELLSAYIEVHGQTAQHETEQTDAA